MNANTQIKQMELKWNLRINIQEEEEEEDAWVGLGGQKTHNPILF